MKKTVTVSVELFDSNKIINNIVDLSAGEAKEVADAWRKLFPAIAKNSEINEELCREIGQAISTGYFINDVKEKLFESGDVDPGLKYIVSVEMNPNEPDFLLISGIRRAYAIQHFTVFHRQRLFVPSYFDSFHEEEYKEMNFTYLKTLGPGVKTLLDRYRNAADEYKDRNRKYIEQHTFEPGAKIKFLDCVELKRDEFDERRFRNCENRWTSDPDEVFTFVDIDKIDRYNSENGKDCWTIAVKDSDEIKWEFSLVPEEHSPEILLQPA